MSGRDECPHGRTISLFDEPIGHSETPQHLPQVKCICAWTVGRYATWAVEQVQTGAQGHLLAQMTEVYSQRLVELETKLLDYRLDYGLDYGLD